MVNTRKMAMAFFTALPFCCETVHAAEASTSCANSSPGSDPTRIIWDAAGSPYFDQPCGTGAPAGSVEQCQPFTYLGEKLAATCAGDDACYARISVDGGNYWISDAKAGLPSNPACQGWRAGVGHPGQGSQAADAQRATRSTGRCSNDGTSPPHCN